MPRGIKTTEKVKVGVSVGTKEGERTYTLTIKCSVAEMFLADAFVMRGIVEKLSETLESSARKAVNEYLEAPDKYLAKTKMTASNGHQSAVKAA